MSHIRRLIRLTQHTRLARKRRTAAVSPSQAVVSCYHDRHLLSNHHSLLALAFWKDRRIWHRAHLNTLRCLVGCTAGDFSTMWALQANYPALNVSIIMASSSKLVAMYLQLSLCNICHS